MDTWGQGEHVDNRRTVAIVAGVISAALAFVASMLVTAPAVAVTAVAAVIAAVVSGTALTPLLIRPLPGLDGDAEEIAETLDLVRRALAAAPGQHTSEVARRAGVDQGVTERALVTLAGRGEARRSVRSEWTLAAVPSEVS